MLDKTNSGNDLHIAMADMGIRARNSASVLAIASSERKHAALLGMAQAIIAHREKILNANAIDMENGRKSGLSASFLDRLELNAERIQTMANGMKDIAALTDPVGRILSPHRWV